MPANLSKCSLMTIGEPEGLQEKRIGLLEKRADLAEKQIEILKEGLMSFLEIQAGIK